MLKEFLEKERDFSVLDKIIVVSLSFLPIIFIIGVL